MAETTNTFVPRGKSGHQIPDDSALKETETVLTPLVEVEKPRTASAAEHARSILQGSNIGTLASLTSDGSPWASIVQYGTMDNGSPVIIVSTLALHGRNLAADKRASLAVAAPVPKGHDPGDSGRVTLAGVVEEPLGDEREEAKQAFFKEFPAAEAYAEFGDFAIYVLRVDKVRWVGGFGRMASATPADFATAEPDPVAKNADYAVEHMNEDHADALLAMARAFTGHTDTTEAKALRADRYGMDLGIVTPRGETMTRVAFTEPVDAPDGLRAATVDLARRAREALGEPAPAAH